MISNVIKHVISASVFAAALASSLDVSAQAKQYYPAPRSLVSTDAVTWQARSIRATASTGLTDITVTTVNPLRIGHSIEIQIQCAHDTFASVSSDSNYTIGDASVSLECPDGEIIQQADVTVIVGG